nr:MAG TPA: hypothetical protein [Caudoviricetes sp.]
MFKNGGVKMATATQITLIICATIMILSLVEKKGDK